MLANFFQAIKNLFRSKPDPFTGRFKYRGVEYSRSDILADIREYSSNEMQDYKRRERLLEYFGNQP